MGGQWPAARVSVIIPCYNAAHTIELQLEALATQTDAPPFEVLLVDNRSTDDLTSIVHRWVARIPRLRLVPAASHRGVSYARNVGIGAAVGDYILFCDSDDCVSTYWVAGSARHLDEVSLFGGSAVPLGEEVFTDVASVRAAFGDVDDRLPLDESQVGLPHPVLMGSTFGVRRDVMLELGGFDQSLPIGGEDNELALRASLRGYPTLVAPSVRIGYRLRADERALIPLARRDARAHALVCSRHGQWKTSPHRSGAQWVLGPVRGLAALAKARLFAPETIPLVLRRLAFDVGFLEGFVRYRVLRRCPAPLLGLGIEEGREWRTRVDHGST